MTIPVKARNFKDLQIWKLGMEIVSEIYEFTKKFPKTEIFGLTDQMRRSAVSIPCNISEGFNRYHNKEFKQFLYVSLGSCAELETQVEISFRLGFISESIKSTTLEALDHEARMLVKYIKKL